MYIAVECDGERVAPGASMKNSSWTLYGQFATFAEGISDSISGIFRWIKSLCMKVMLGKRREVVHVLVCPEKHLAFRGKGRYEHCLCLPKIYVRKDEDPKQCARRALTDALAGLEFHPVRIVATWRRRSDEGLVVPNHFMMAVTRQELPADFLEHAREFRTVKANLPDLPEGIERLIQISVAPVPHAHQYYG